MADTADLAPSRSTTSKAPSRRAANGSRSPARRSTRTRAREENLEDQVDRLQSDIKAIAATLTKMADDKVSEVRGTAKTEARNLVKQGQTAVDEIQDEFGHMEKQIKDIIREKPLTAVAGAVALGFVLALVTR
jgi:ElaB/YqjD/DUF883 family membrane-anchored ribosome-binding protein